MRHDYEFETFARKGVEKPRSYYIPFGENEEFAFDYGIPDRKASSRFISLDGEWLFGAHESIDTVEADEELHEKIPVPSCVQMHGYDAVQYLNTRYPIPADPPHVRVKNPAFHYRKFFTLTDLTQKYYLDFEGVDSFFYVYVNGKRVGYSQISHATSEWDITDYVREGENVLDAVVLKWSAGTYLECQDKFRFSGIFRSVYLLQRPHKHITDFKISTGFNGKDGEIRVLNMSDVPFSAELNGEVQTAKAGESVTFTVKNAEPWTAENPFLYDVVLRAEGEKILQRAGLRTVEIKDGVWLFNGKPLKLKGVNRHEFSPEAGATVTVEETVRDLETMKWANVNAIRTCHYPDCPEFYDLCDAMGFYVLDEADVETHGMSVQSGEYTRKHWQEFADSGIADDGVADREINLYERDKNRTCVVMWSLGNEANWGSMFFAGADYIHARDSRPIFYESAWEMHDKSGYYTHRIDVAGRMYPPLADMKKFLRDKKETRPLLLCEYSHSMGNSNGDLGDYWNLIDCNERFMGAFVWEWRDHAIKTEKGYMYGGDFGEKEHDGNFCVDGLLNPDGTPKSGLYEMRAVYGGKRKKRNKPLPCEPLAEIPQGKPAEYELGENGELKALGKLRFESPLTVHVERAYIDNDMYIRNEWQRYEGAKQIIYRRETEGNSVKLYGKTVKSGLSPIMEFTLTYTFFAGGADVELQYKVSERVTYLPRIGVTFALGKDAERFTYAGYGPHESYIDKHLGSEYGVYESSAEKEYFPYVKPQESGSHYGCTRVAFANGLQITAARPFSCSVLPYDTQTLKSAKHDFELPPSDRVHVCLDVAMSGVGTNSCGPALAEKYRAPKTGYNKFRILLG